MEILVLQPKRIIRLQNNLSLLATEHCIIPEHWKKDQFNPYFLLFNFKLHHKALFLTLKVRVFLKVWGTNFFVLSMSEFSFWRLSIVACPNLTPFIIMSYNKVYNRLPNITSFASSLWYRPTRQPDLSVKW